MNIHLRNLNKEDLEIIEQVKKETKEKTGSKAILQAISEYLLYKRKYFDLEKRYFELIDKKINREPYKNVKKEINHDTINKEIKNNDEALKELINKHIDI